MRKSTKTIAREAKQKKSLRGIKDPKVLKKILKPVRRPGARRSPQDTAKAQATFLATLAKTGNVGASCRAAGVARSTAYDIWRCEQPDKEYTEQELKAAEVFKKLWREALENATDLLEAEARRRGVHGYDRPIVYKGKIVGTYKEYSDRMLELLLKAHRRKQFGDKTELSGPDGGPVSVVRKVERVIVDPKRKESDE